MLQLCVHLHNVGCVNFTSIKKTDPQGEVTSSSFSVFPSSPQGQLQPCPHITLLLQGRMGEAPPPEPDSLLISPSGCGHPTPCLPHHLNCGSSWGRGLRASVLALSLPEHSPHSYPGQSGSQGSGFTPVLWTLSPGMRDVRREDDHGLR